MDGVFSYALLHDGTAHTRGTDYTSGCDTVEEFFRFVANRPHPKPVDVVHVWAGDQMVREPDLVCPRRRARSLQAVPS
jgi:hypothetical protein